MSLFQQNVQARYMERDRLELEEIRRRIRPPMQQYYLQVMTYCWTGGDAKCSALSGGVGDGSDYGCA